jgi:hypothetical protein
MEETGNSEGRRGIMYISADGRCSGQRTFTTAINDDIRDENKGVSSVKSPSLYWETQS